MLGSSKLAQAHPTMYCSVLLVVKWILKVNGVGLDFPLSPPNVDISKPIVNENTQYHKSRLYKFC